MGFKLHVEIGMAVYHKAHGEGVITKVTEEKVFVKFGTKMLIFWYPKAFEQDDLILVNAKENPIIDLEDYESSNEKSKSIKSRRSDGINEPLVGEYWFNRTSEVLDGVVKTADYVGRRDGTHIRFRCYAVRRKERLEVWLNPPSKGESEFISVWIRDGLIPLNEVNPHSGKKKDFKRSGFTECEVRFYISKPRDKEKEMEEAFDFIRELRQLVDH